jgi:uncharacterized protein YndB with AHSA1/START domain
MSDELDSERALGVQDLHGHEAQTLLIRRRYTADAEDVWDACTDPDRMARFFMRPQGDLREGGTFSFQGNAGGTILRCEPPRRLRVTWVYGDPGDLPPDEVELRIVPDGTDRTVLELEHVSAGGIDPYLLNDKAQGIFGLGAGWELGLVALGWHLAGTFPDVEPAALEETPEIAALADRISDAWAEVLAASR